MNQQFTVAGIGELLWDVFPSHKRPGGAPTNFSCHCRRLGAQAYPVSCVGTDNLGLEIREELQQGTSLSWGRVSSLGTSDRIVGLPRPIEDEADD